MELNSDHSDVSLLRLLDDVEDDRNICEYSM